VKKTGDGTAYLLHFDRPYGPGGGANGRGTAGHYLGWAKNLEQRLAQHEAGTGARLMQVVKDAGIGWRLARTWKEGGLARESQLKKQGGRSRMCPQCRAAKAEARQQPSVAAQAPPEPAASGSKPAGARQAETGGGHHQPRDQRHPSAVAQALAAPAPPRPQPDPHQRGAHVATRLVQTRFGAGRTVGQMQAAHESITRPFREESHRTAAQAQMYRGYADTVTSGLTEPGTARRGQAKTQAEAADRDMEAG
jgi:predicted GIY-YIG superfamily endonuclease